MYKLLFLLLILLVNSGCSQRLVDFTMISSKNVDLSRGAHFKRQRTRIHGEDAIHVIIFIPTGIPNAKEAMDRAIESVPGAVALLDGVITRKWFYIPLIYGKEWFVVEGTALVDPELVTSNKHNENDYSIIRVNDDGNVEDVHSVNSEEYKSEKAKLLNRM